MLKIDQFSYSWRENIQKYFRFAKYHMYFPFALLTTKQYLAHNSYSHTWWNNLLLGLSDYMGYGTLEEKQVLGWVQTYKCVPSAPPSAPLCQTH